MTYWDRRCILWYSERAVILSTLLATGHRKAHALELAFCIPDSWPRVAWAWLRRDYFQLFKLHKSRVTRREIRKHK